MVVEYCADRALEPVVIAEGVASVDNASAWLLRALQEMREPLDVVASANSEDIVREQLGDAVEVVFRAQWDAWDDQGLGEVLSQLPSLSPRTERGLLAPQLKVVANLEGRLAKDPLYVGGLTDSVLSALDLLARNPTLDEHEEEQKKLYNEEKNKAWRKFRGGLKVLEHYKALEGAHPSELGHRVSSFAWDNDLWAGIVFGKTKQLAELNDAELAGVALLMNVDGDRAKREKFFGGPCTPALQVSK